MIKVIDVACLLIYLYGNDAILVIPVIQIMNDYMVPDQCILLLRKLTKSVRSWSYLVCSGWSFFSCGPGYSDTEPPTWYELLIFTSAGVRLLLVEWRRVPFSIHFGEMFMRCHPSDLKRSNRRVRMINFYTAPGWRIVLMGLSNDAHVDVQFK